MTTLRTGSVDDADGIAAIEAAAAHRPWSLDAVRAHLVDPTRRTVVVTEGGVLLGHVLASAVAGEGEVLTVAVHPDARRRGLGRQLLHALYRIWTEDDVAVAWLEVRDDNLAALALYEADGWESTGRRKGYYGDCDALVMRREVP